MRSTHLCKIIIDECFSTTCALPSHPTLVMRIMIANPSLYFQELLTALDDLFSTVTLYHGALWVCSIMHVSA